jgi:hypothetical protein
MYKFLLNAKDVCACAASFGQLEILIWARTNGASWDKSTCSHAATGGHSAATEWDEYVCTLAVCEGQLDVFYWTIANGAPCDYDEVCSVAAKYGQLDILKWAKENEIFHGTIGHVQKQLLVVILMFFNGQWKMVQNVTHMYVQLRLKVAISLCFNGMNIHVYVPLKW